MAFKMICDRCGKEVKDDQDTLMANFKRGWRFWMPEEEGLWEGAEKTIQLCDGCTKAFLTLFKNRPKRGRPAKQKA